MGFEGDVGGSASGAGFGDPSTGGWSGRGDVDAGTTGVDWSGRAAQALAALAALAAQSHPLGAVVNPMAQASLAKARGLSDEEIERAAMMATPLGSALSNVSRFGGGLQKGALALGAQGGPQPGMGAQPTSGGFGFGEFGAAPGRAPLGLAAQVFAPPSASWLTTPPLRLRDTGRGRAPGGMLGDERGL